LRGAGRWQRCDVTLPGVCAFVARLQVQWRFCNRAIDEVECGNVPAILLITR
jgi:hypothetical protein